VEEVRALRLPEAQERALLGGNAERLFALATGVGAEE
jgi:hypothetical protein